VAATSAAAASTAVPARYFVVVMFGSPNKMLPSFMAASRNFGDPGRP
jgi:hypothetical protein